MSAGVCRVRFNQLECLGLSRFQRAINSSARRAGQSHCRFFGRWLPGRHRAAAERAGGTDHLARFRRQSGEHPERPRPDRGNGTRRERLSRHFAAHRAGVYPISDSVSINASGIVMRGVGNGTNGTVLYPTSTKGAIHRPKSTSRSGDCQRFV